MVVFLKPAKGSQCDESEALTSPLGTSVGEFEGLTSPPWALPGLQLRLPDQGLIGSFGDPPRVLINEQPRGAFLGFTASIEETVTRGVDERALVDWGAESISRTPSMGPWAVEIASRFAELLALPSDWDGHGASAVLPLNLLAAGRFLATVMAPETPPPTAVPTANGGLQLEWHRAGLDVELLFGDEEEPPMLFVAEVESGREWEGPPVEGFAEFDLAQRLLG